MIGYIAKREIDGFIDYRYVSTKPIDVSGSGWILVPVEIREYDEKRRRLEDAAEYLLETCKTVCGLLRAYKHDHELVLELLLGAIAKAEGKNARIQNISVSNLRPPTLVGYQTD